MTDTPEHRCWFRGCAAPAPYGRGFVLSAAPMIWACREHRQPLDNRMTAAPQTTEVTHPAPPPPPGKLL